MRYNPQHDFDRILSDERERLLREVSTQKMSWRKVGNLIKLNNLLRMRDR